MSPHLGAAIVVGGSGGLGAAICEALALDWSGVVVGYHSNRAAAEAVAEAIGATAFSARLDLTESDTIEETLQLATARFGRIGAIVHACGVNIAQPYVSQTEETAWREVIEVELLGATRLVRAGIEQLRRNGGAFTFVTSFANVYFPPGDALSSVPKAGVEALSRAVAKEEGRFGIRSNCVAPGLIEAGLGASFIGALHSQEVWGKQRSRTPLRRFGRAADVADAVSFLSSDRASFITGQTIVVDGGLSL